MNQPWREYRPTPASGMIDAMLALILSTLRALRAGFRPRADLVIENLALRQQLVVLQRNSKRPRLRHLDRAFWLLLSRIWSRFADVLVIVKPDTIVRWHRHGFRLFWRWKSRPPRKPKKGEVTPRGREGGASVFLEGGRTGPGITCTHADGERT